MKKISFYLLALVALLLASCSSDNSADVRALLNTVPSSSSMVTVLNLQKMLEKAGASVDGDLIVFPEEVTNAVNSIKNKEDRELASMMLGGQAGIDPSAAVIFSDGYVMYFTGRLIDTKKFEQFVSKVSGSQFESRDGVKMLGRVAMLDDRFWLILDGRGEIDPVQVKGYAALTEAQSILSKDIAETLVGFDNDILGWADISGMLSVADLNFEKRALYKLAFETLYEDAKSILFNVDFLDGRAECVAHVQNSKGKDAKALLNLGKIDDHTLLKIAGPANMVMAANVPAKMISDLEQRTSGNASMINIVLQSMKGVDGTMGIAFGKDQQTFRGVITTTGGDMGEFMNMLGGARINRSYEGKYLLFNSGEVDGLSTVTRLSAELKGASLGASMYDEWMKDADVSSCAVLFNSVGGSLEMKVVLKGADEKSNILRTLLSHMH